MIPIAKRDATKDSSREASEFMELWETPKTDTWKTPPKGLGVSKFSSNPSPSTRGSVYESLLPNQLATPGSSPSCGYDSYSEASQAVVIDQDSGKLFPHVFISEFFLPFIVDLEGVSDNEPPNLCTRFTRWLHCIDLCLSTPIHQLGLPAWLECFVLFWAQVFSVWFTPLTFTVTCFFLEPKEAMTLLIAGIFTPIVNSTLKGLFLRERPNRGTIAFRNFNLRKSLKNHSFPSGDSAEAGCWSVSVFLSTRSYPPLFAFPLTMFARVYFGAHYVGDTLVGASLGCIVAVLVDDANYNMINDMSGDPFVREWFQKFLIFAMIPASTLPAYYFYLCAKGLRG
jgi:membrane-associated phospholipid phosphatase